MLKLLMLDILVFLEFRMRKGVSDSDPNVCKWLGLFKDNIVCGV